MLCACTARSGHLLSEGLARTKDANSSVALGDSKLVGKRLHGDTIDVDPSQRFGIFGFECLGETGDAATDFVAYRLSRLLRVLDFRCEQRERTIRGLEATGVIHDCIAEHPIEPGRSGLVIAQGRQFVQAAHKCVMQNVLGKLPISHAALEESQELAMIFNENARYIRVDRSRHSFAGLVTHNAISSTQAARGIERP